MSEQFNPRPRLFEFITGDEIDVDRYTALSIRDDLAHFQLREGYIRIQFETAEQLRSEIDRMRQWRDEWRVIKRHGEATTA
jgi:hypothetical protein